tara:strand:+ start:484 stop:660 length:177 start_codon:yes stop_codon:yes gene_type:complete
MIPAKLIRLLMPKVVDHIVKSFKLDKVLKYVEKPNDADKRIDALENRIKKIENKSVGY